MGTRGVLGVVVDGVEKLAYNQFDSYPGGLGIGLLGELRTAEQEWGDDWLIKLRLLAKGLEVVAEDSVPTTEQIEKLQHYADLDVATRSLDDWYCLLRKTQGKLLWLLAAGIIVNASDFPADSLFCEWGYVIDFDPDVPVLEVYEGFQQAPHSAGRFAGKKLQRDYTTELYYPIRLIKRYNLTELPSDKQLELDCDPPEEDK